MHSILNDLRFAIRSFRRTPAFTLIALATMALGIAANVTVFSFVNAIFLRDLPVKNADRLVRVFSKHQTRDLGLFSYPAYAYVRDHSTTLDQVAAHYSTAPLYVSANGQSGELEGAVVSADYFPMLGVTPRLGRFFDAHEDSTPDGDAVAVISYGMWQSWFGGDPEIAGKSVVINRKPFQVIGVAPREFRGVEVGFAPNEIWIPTMMLRTGYRWCDALQDNCTPLEIMGPLAPGKSAQDATAELATLMGQYASARPAQDINESAWASPAKGVRNDSQRDMLEVARLLSATAAGLLLIACINLAGLLVARGAARSREISMRLSLGAGRRRIVRQLLTENLLLAVIGGAAGLLISQWTSRLLMGFFVAGSEGYLTFYNVDLDAGTLAWAVAISLVTGILFGILPAFEAARPGNTVEILRGANSAPRSRSVLLICQVGLSLALLVGAGLLTRSAGRIEAGRNFDPHHVALLRLRPRLAGYSPAQAQRFTHAVVQRLQSLPEVVSASMTNGSSGAVWGPGMKLRVTLPGEPNIKKDRERLVNAHEIAPRFFETLRIPFVQGRDFDDHDVAGSPRVAIVNETLAAQTWPGAIPLGRVIQLEGQPYRVVGLVRDSQLRTVLAPPLPMAFIPYWQNNIDPQIDSRMCVRVTGDPAAALPRLKAAIASVDPDVPVAETMPMLDQVRNVFVEVRLAKTVLLSAGGLAVLLSAIGLYGILAFVVERRTREIGIRMALGARPPQVLQLILRQGLTLVCVGSAVGLVLAFATTRLLGTFLYGVPATDPISFLGGAAVLLGVASLASYLPSRRAALVDPMVALRHE